MASKREEQLKEITERLEQGVAEFFNSEHYAEYLKTMSKFHNYSFNNTLLIAMQKPDATLVAGYQAWQSKFNRHVRRGEKGIKIIAPVPIMEKELREKRDELTDELILKPDGQPEMEEVTHTIPRFRVTTVFDVGQTDGDPLPDLGVKDLTVNVENYDIFMEAIAKVSPVPIRFDEIGSGAKGYYSSADKEIVIQSGMSQSQTLKTAIHETAHAKLHDRDYMSKEGIQKDRMTLEVEAESVAYTVCQQFGIDTSDYSFPYVASWSSSKGMPELRSSMDTIRHTSSDFIEEMTSQIDLIREERQTKYEIIYDFCDEFTDEHGIVENFTGDWHELQEEIKRMRTEGCYNITATALEEGLMQGADQTVGGDVSPESEVLLTADDITNIRCTHSEFYPGSRTAIHTLECEVRGVPDILTYEVSQHDDGEGFVLHTEKDDIWDKMPMPELRKLELVVSREVEFYGWVHQLEEAETADDVREVRYGLWESENTQLTSEQVQNLNGMIDAKEEALSGSDPERNVPPIEPYHDLAECPKKSVLEALRECRNELKEQEKQAGSKLPHCRKGEQAI